MPGIFLFIGAVLANVTSSSWTKSWWTVSVDAPGLCSFLGSPRVFEPVHDVVHMQRLPVASRFQGVELRDVMLDLLPRWMLILAEPALESRQLQLRVEARSHSGFVREGQETGMRWTDGTRWSNDGTDVDDLTGAVRLGTLRPMMIRRRHHRVEAQSQLLLLQPALEIPPCFFRQVVASATER